MAYGYVFAQIEITDPEAYPRYIAMVQPTIEAFGGAFLVRGGRAEVYEGTPPGSRNVLIRFPLLRGGARLVPFRAICRGEGAAHVCLDKRADHRRRCVRNNAGGAHDQAGGDYRGGAVGHGAAPRVSVGQAEGRGDPGDRLFREAGGLGRPLELHVAHGARRVWRAGARLDVPLSLVERPQGGAGVRRLFLRGAFRQADRQLSPARGAGGLYQGPDGEGRRAPLGAVSPCRALGVLRRRLRQVHRHREGPAERPHLLRRSSTT